MYKSIVLAFVIYSVTINAQNTQQPYPPELQQCINETKATEADIQNFKTSSVPNTTASACLMACMGKKFGMMNPDNTFNLEKALANLEEMKKVKVPEGLPQDLPQKLETAFKSCKAEEVKNDDQCKAAKSFAECMEAQRKKLGLPERA